MHTFEAVYDDEEGLFPVEYVLKGSYEWQPPEPDVGIMVGGFSDIQITSVSVKIGEFEVFSPCHSVYRTEMTYAFNKKLETCKTFSDWLEDQINNLAEASEPDVE